MGSKGVFASASASAFARAFALLQRVGRAFMLPIALLPVAGLLLGVGSSLASVVAHPVWQSIFSVFSAVGGVIFDNLPLLFAMGIAIGMTDEEKATAALSAAIAFFVMHATIGTLLTRFGLASVEDGTVTSVVGIRSLQMGVFGGIVVGLGVAFLHRRFYRIELPPMLSFFAGTRFVPIVSTLVYILVGVVLFYAWRPVQSGIFWLGSLVGKSGIFGTWLYGFLERLLIPFGLHHVFYLPFWQTGVGGSAMIDGTLVYGAQNIFFAELASPNTTAFSVSATRFMSGKFPMMIFGLPGAALAMYHCAGTNGNNTTSANGNRRKAGSLLFSAALTSMVTGITEPLEFTFLFASPLLYGLHCVLAGLAYMLMHLCGVGVGMTFSGGVIDLILFGVLQGNERTHWLWIPIVGVGLAIVYYLVFRYLILRKDYKTPGREEGGEVKLHTRADLAAKTGSKMTKAAQIVAGLGGRANVRSIDSCATRLRITVADGAKVDKSALAGTGALGVLVSGNGVQVVYGPGVEAVRRAVEQELKEAKNP